MGTALGVAACSRLKAPSESLQKARSTLLERAASQGFFGEHRLVSHVSHVCSLRIGGDWFPVLDVQELVRGAVTARGANSIIVIDSELRMVRRFDYTSERPLFCRENRLFVFGDLQIDGVVSQGNELTFTDRGRVVALRHVDANEIPAPAAGDAIEQ